MLAADEDALICDFAETYHILNVRGLPASLAATLACGLPDESRIMRKLSGEPQTLDTRLLAAAVDKLSLLVWAQTKDGQKGRNRPPSVYQALSTSSGKGNGPDSFASGADFEAARKRLLEGGK